MNSTVELELIKYKDPEQKDYEYFWIDHQNNSSIVGPSFRTEANAMEWLKNLMEKYDRGNATDNIKAN